MREAIRRAICCAYCACRTWADGGPQQASVVLSGHRADAALVAVALVWGVTFVMVRDAVAIVPPLTFLALRFALATAVMMPFYGRRVWRAGRVGWRDGALVGLFLLGGYAFQTAGLRHTTAGRAGFITGLAVILVPFVAWLWLRRAPARSAIVGALVAVTGLALLTLPALVEAGGGLTTLWLGDLLVLGCAVSFALHIVAIGRVARTAATRYDPAALATVQISTTALACAVGALLFENGWAWLVRGFPPDVWFAAAFTGLLATAAAFGLQSAAQASVSPERTALIFATEPVFAALFAWWLAGEQLGSPGWAGGALIVAGMVAGAWWGRGGIEPAEVGLIQQDAAGRHGGCLGGRIGQVVAGQPLSAPAPDAASGRAARRPRVAGRAEDGRRA